MTEKFCSMKFEDYINQFDLFNLHKDKNKEIEQIIQNLNHTIFYGPPGIGKYTQVLNIVRHYSPTQLKYERKMNFSYDNKNYVFKISDIHIEVDFQLLGCKAKNLFNELYYHIIKNYMTTYVKNNNITVIIICKNFHNIHSELLNIFYSYIQTLFKNKISLVYFILTEHISFIPNIILKRCNIISFQRPEKKKYIDLLKVSDFTNVNKRLLNKKNINKLTNIKDFLSNNTIFEKMYENTYTKIYNCILNYKEIQYIKLREYIYELLIYDINMDYFLFYIIKKLYKSKLLNNEKLNNFLFYYYSYIKLYNNNYRTIYHLERILLYLCKEIHEL